MPICAAAHRAGATVRDSKHIAMVLEGDLAHISLSSVLQLAEAESVTGRLTLRETRSIDLLRGVPVAAQLDHITGITAVLDLFTEPGERFSLVLNGAITGRPLGDTLGLILEGCRIADDWARLANLITRPVNVSEIAVQSPAARVLAKLNGRTTIGEATRQAGVARSDVVDDLTALVEARQLLELTTPPPPERDRAPLPSDYFTALEVGRTALRAGAYDQAEAAFTHALSLRPGDRVAAQNLRRATDLRTTGRAGTRFWSNRGQS